MLMTRGGTDPGIGRWEQSGAKGRAPSALGRGRGAFAQGQGDAFSRERRAGVSGLAGRSGPWQGVGAGRGLAFSPGCVESWTFALWLLLGWRERAARTFGASGFVLEKAACFPPVALPCHTPRAFPGHQTCGAFPHTKQLFGTPAGSPGTELSPDVVHRQVASEPPTTPPTAPG